MPLFWFEHQKTLPSENSASTFLFCLVVSFFFYSRQCCQFARFLFFLCSCFLDLREVTAHRVRRLALACVCLCMCVCAIAELWWSIKSSQTKSSLSPHALCIGITFHQVAEKPQRCLTLASILKAKQKRRCVILTATVELSTCYINKSRISQQERRQRQPVWWHSTHKKGVKCR